MRCLKTIVSTFALCAMTIPALAQDDGGKAPPAGDAPRQRPPRGEGAAGPGQRPGQLTPEKAKAAWDLEAKGVAHTLGLNADQTAKLTAAYSQARADNNKSMEK